MPLGFWFHTSFFSFVWFSGSFASFSATSYLRFLFATRKSKTKQNERSFLLVNLFNRENKAFLFLIYGNESMLLAKPLLFEV